MSLSGDVFSLPTRCLIQNSRKFYDSLQRSLDTRVGYDQGQFSDHLIVCQMFQEWISWRIANSKQKIPSARHILLQKFCRVHAIRSTCLLVLENTVAWIATQLLGSLPPTSELYPSIKTLSTINEYLELDQLELSVPFNKDNNYNGKGITSSILFPPPLGETEVRSFGKNVETQRKLMDSLDPQTTLTMSHRGRRDWSTLPASGPVTTRG